MTDQIGEITPEGRPEGAARKPRSSGERYLLMNIGCIECGVTSAVVGIYDDFDFATALAEKLNSIRAFYWRQGGQNSYEVFVLPTTVNSTHIDYAIAVASNLERKQSE